MCIKRNHIKRNHAVGIIATLAAVMLGTTSPTSVHAAATAWPTLSSDAVSSITASSGSVGNYISGLMLSGALKPPSVSPSSLTIQTGNSGYIAVVPAAPANRLRIGINAAGCSGYYDLNIAGKPIPIQLTIVVPSTAQATTTPLNLEVVTINAVGAPSAPATVSLTITTPPSQSVTGGTGKLQDLSWPKFHANASNTGYHWGTGCTGTLQNAFKTNGYVVASCAIGNDGKVYFGATDLKFYCIEADAKKGQLYWSYNMNNTVQGGTAVGSDGTVYTGCSDGYLYAFGPGTNASGGQDFTQGVLKWKFQAHAPISCAPSFSKTGLLYIIDNLDRVYSVNPDGTQKWVFQAGPPLQPGLSSFACPAVTTGGTVIVGALDGYLYALNGLTGAKIWAVNTGSPIVSSPAIGTDGTIYVGSNNHKLYAINGSTGAIKWTYTTGAAVESSPAIAPDASAIYVGSDDTYLYAIQPTSGSLLWKYRTLGKVTSSPAIDYSTRVVYVGSEDDNLYALNGKTGALVWRYQTRGPIRYSSPAVRFNGHVFFGSFDGNLYDLK